MKKLTKLIIALACILCFQNCKNDDFVSENLPISESDEATLRDEQFKAENFGNATTGKFIGSVVSNTGAFLENVQITIGNTVTTTDRNGIFILNDVNVFENFAHIKASKQGYINGSRVVIPKSDGANRIDIVLLKKEITGSVNSGETSQVSLPDGAQVNFSGEFIKQDGSEYNGQVDVVLNYVAPNSFRTFTQMPGSLLAQTTDNEARNLATYGMLSVNLFSPSGESLNINENSVATLKFPVHFSQTSTAPDTIKLWYFDEEQGYWKEEGQATKSGNFYTGEVSHFTWWNCDVPFDSVEFCFSLIPDNTAQSTPYYVIIKRITDDQFIYSGVVYSRASVCGLIPRNEELNISIYQVADLCFGQLVDSQTIGGYATDTSTEILFNEAVDLLTTNITGFANNCDGNPITNGYLYINEYNSFSITDGTINVGLQHCEEQTTTIQLYDFHTNQWTIIDNVPLDNESFDLGTISTCEDTGGIFNGNLRLSTQQEVNDFGAFGFTSVSGEFLIGNEDANTDITDLSPLASITTISEDLIIAGNENLQNLQDLSNIAFIGGKLTILSNDGLTSLAGFNNSITIEGSTIAIINNNSLTSLAGLEYIINVNSLNISENDALTTLEGLENMTSVSGLVIRNNNALNSLSALSNLSSLEQLYIFNNDALTTLIGLEQITQAVYIWIINNDALLNVNGLDNLTTMTVNNQIATVSIGATPDDIPGAFIEGPNPNLTDFCALQNLFSNGNGTSVVTYIGNNAYNPTPQDIINGNCSQ